MCLLSWGYMINHNENEDENETSELLWKVVRQLMSQPEYTMFITNNHALFHLLWMENLAKYLKVLIYFDHGC